MSRRKKKRSAVPIILYILAAVFLLLLGMYAWPTKPAADLEKTSLQPIDAGDVSKLDVDFDLEDLSTEIENSDPIGTLLKQNHSLLGEFFAQKIHGVLPDRPDFIDGEFSASGIDRNKFEVRFDGDRIKAGRWLATETAPQFEGANALDDFFENTMLAWKQANLFGIDFKLYQVTENESQVTARAVVEIFGHTKAARGGLQATSIWETVWFWGDDQLVLSHLKIIGREELVIRVENGQLLQDASMAVFGDSEAWNEQLRYGLDQWARQIPGINVVGNQGIAVEDIDGDGLDDIYVCEPHGLPNLLFLQNSDGTVREIAAQAGLNILDESRSTLILDLDNDGDQDLAVATDDSLLLYSNDGHSSFRLEASLRSGSNGTSLSAADFDRDGDLDLYLCRATNSNCDDDLDGISIAGLEGESGARNVLFRNDEGWVFEDVTSAVGLPTQNGDVSRTASWLDVDSDGDFDLFVANEGSSKLYENQEGWFRDITSKFGDGMLAQARSVSVGNFDRDRTPDIFISNDSSISEYRVINDSANNANSETSEKLVAPSHIFYSSGKGEVAADQSSNYRSYPLPSPVFSTGASFGSAAVDVNNDGLDDLLVANGHVTREVGNDLLEYWTRSLLSVQKGNQGSKELLENRMHEIADLIRMGGSFAGPQRNRAYLNLGAVGFANFSAASGIDLPNDARAIATTDWDNDGDVDVVLVSRNGPRVRLLLNQNESDNQYVSLFLESTECNADAIGARVEVWLEDSNAPIVRWVTAGSGYLAQSSRKLQVGLGRDAAISKIVVGWPGGKDETFEGLQVNQMYRLVQGKRNPVAETFARVPPSLNVGGVPINLDAPTVQRSVFFPSVTMPPINIKGRNESWYRLEESDGRSLLTIFHDGGADSESLLLDFMRGTDQLDRSGIGCAAVYCGKAGADLNSEVKLSEDLLSNLEWPYPSGVASEHELGKLKLAFGEWFCRQSVPDRPFGILQDETGRVKAFYSSPVLSFEEILKDQSIAKAENAVNWSEFTGLQGYWTNEDRFANDERMIQRFEELGMVKASEHLEANSSKAAYADRLTRAGIDYFFANDFQNAKLFLNRAIKEDAKCVAAHIYRGHLLRAISSQTAGKSPEKVTLLGDASTSYTNALNVKPGNEEAVIGYAKSQIDLGSVDTAIDRLREFLEDFPDSANVHALLGRQLLSRRQFEEAKNHLSTAFDNHPTLTGVAGALGFLSLRSGDAKTAQNYLRTAHQLRPSDRNILRFLAESEFAARDFEAAGERFQSYLLLRPSELRPNCILAWILSTSPRNAVRNPQRGLNLLSPLLDLHGAESAMVNEVAAACYAEAGDFAKATELQSKAAKLIEENRTADPYSEAQRIGMEERLQLYRRESPYRTDDFSKIPIRAIQNSLEDSASVR